MQAGFASGGAGSRDGVLSVAGLRDDGDSSVGGFAAMKNYQDGVYTGSRDGVVSVAGLSKARDTQGSVADYQRGINACPMSIVCGLPTESSS